MANPSSKLNILVIPSWYPTVEKPNYGIFTKVQCQILQKSPEVNLAVIYAKLAPLPIWHLFSEPRFQHTIEDGIATFRMTGFALPKFHDFFFKAWARRYERLFQYYLRNNPSPDAIHAHDYLAGYAARFIGKKYGIPYILTIHNSSFLSQTVPHRWQKPILEILDAAALIFCVSPHHRDALSAYTENPFEVLPNPIETSLFFLTPEVNKRDDAFQWISVGSLIPRKNHSLLLEAFALFQRKRLCRSKLLIVGDGPLKGRLNRQAKNLKLGHSVKFIETLSQKELAKKFRQSNALILSSNYESFGLVAAEAMACGLPVIATRSGGPEHFIDKTSGILVPPKDPNAMALAIYEMYTNYSRYNPQAIAESILNICDPAFFQRRSLESYRKAISQTLV